MCFGLMKEIQACKSRLFSDMTSTNLEVQRRKMIINTSKMNNKSHGGSNLQIAGHRLQVIVSPIQKVS